VIKRRKTRTVSVGPLKIGSDHPVVIQSMTKVDTSDIGQVVVQIRQLEEAGCEIVRVAVKDKGDAKAISSIKKEVTVPLVADIHFDYKLALEAIKCGADKIRINPGNIKKTKDVEKVIDAASDKNIPIRVGVNSGSLMEIAAGKGLSPQAMVNALLRYMENFRKRNFDDLIISLKSSDVSKTIEAYKKMADECDYPFHVGVTAAGLPEDGVIKSSIGIGALLLDGIGDTIRVSLTGEPTSEVEIAKRILSSVGSRYFGPEIISCPTCGRCQVNLVPIVKNLESELRHLTHKEPLLKEKQLLVAVMGCEVNGPGEAKGADIGIAFGRGKGVIFRRGEVVKTVKTSGSVKELLDMIKKEI